MTIRRALALSALAAVALGGCNKRDAAATLDAGADARARTAAKTVADLVAAERAGAAPLPRTVAPPSQRPAPPATTPAARATPPADDVENAADANL